MKRIFLNTAVLALSLHFWSCSSNTETQTETSTPATTQACTYTFLQEHASIKWTAFKTTEHIGVGGEFTSFISANVPEGAASPEAAVTGIQLQIPVNSTKTGDEGRDQRIVDYFFGTFTNTDTVKAEVLSFNADGSGIIKIELNQIAKEVAFTGTIDGKNISAEAVLDLNEFDGQAAIDSLNMACKDLHAGKDGITKLWPDVKLEISAQLFQECP